MATDEDKREEGKWTRLRTSIKSNFRTRAFRINTGSDSLPPGWVNPAQRRAYNWQKRVLFGFWPKNIVYSKGVTFFVLGFMAISALFILIFLPGRLKEFAGVPVVVGLVFLWQRAWWDSIWGQTYKMVQEGQLRPNDETLCWDLITPDQSAQDALPPDDIETRLRRLEDLKEKGLLTDAEYQAKREEILGEV